MIIFKIKLTKVRYLSRIIIILINYYKYKNNKWKGVFYGKNGKSKYC